MVISRFLPIHVPLKSLIRWLVERIAPLTEIRGHVATAADLEPSYPEQRVVRIEGVADAAQVVDCRDALNTAEICSGPQRS